MINLEGTCLFTEAMNNNSNANDLQIRVANGTKGSIPETSDINQGNLTSMTKVLNPKNKIMIPLLMPHKYNLASALFTLAGLAPQKKNWTRYARNMFQSFLPTRHLKKNLNLVYFSYGKYGNAVIDKKWKYFLLWNIKYRLLYLFGLVKETFQNACFQALHHWGVNATW